MLRGEQPGVERLLWHSSTFQVFALSIWLASFTLPVQKATLNTCAVDYSLQCSALVQSIGVYMATYTNRVPKRRVDNSQTVYGNSSLHFRGKVFVSASGLACCQGRPRLKIKRSWLGLIKKACHCWTAFGTFLLYSVFWGEFRVKSKLGSHYSVFTPVFVVMYFSFHCWTACGIFLLDCVFGGKFCSKRSWLEKQDQVTRHHG